MHFVHPGPTTAQGYVIKMEYQIGVPFRNLRMTGYLNKLINFIELSFS
jgi:hypothetical protein